MGDHGDRVGVTHALKHQSQSTHMGPHLSDVSPLNNETHFFFYFSEKLIFKKNWTHHLFLFIFKKESKIRNKTLSDFFLRINMSTKTESKSRVRLPIGMVPYDNTPLSPKEVSTK